MVKINAKLKDFFGEICYFNPNIGFLNEVINTFLLAAGFYISLQQLEQH